MDELHGHEVAAAGGADLVHGDHVGVRQPGHGAGLAQQSVLGLARRSPSAEDLEGDPALEVGIEGSVHDSHPAGAELALEPVAPERRAQVLARATRRNTCSDRRRARHLVVPLAPHADSILQGRAWSLQNRRSGLR